MKVLGALALLLLLVAAPSASAQAGPPSLTVSATQPMPIPYAGSAALAASVTVQCPTILAAMANGGGSAPLTVTAVDAPAWLTVASDPVDLASADSVTQCTQGALSRTVPVAVQLTVATDAPGVVDNIVNFVATLGGESSEPAPATIVVDYDWNYTLVPDITFPFTMTTPSVTFNLTVTQASNARSMVMMEEVQTSAGTVSGLASTVYESEAGKPASKVFPITYTAPTGEWNSTTVSFKAFGHYLLLDSRAGNYDAGTAVTWTFTNGGLEPEGGDGGDDDKDAPAPAGALLALGLVSLAAVLRRRQ